MCCSIKRCSTTRKIASARKPLLLLSSKPFRHQTRFGVQILLVYLSTYSYSKNRAFLNGSKTLPLSFTNALLSNISHYLAGRFATCGLTDIGQCLQQWSRKAQSMLEQCKQLGVGTRCLPVYYERLVLDTERTMRRVLRFLGLPWSDTVLRHQDFVAAAGADGNASHDQKVILNKCVHMITSLARYLRIMNVFVFPYNSYILNVLFTRIE